MGAVERNPDAVFWIALSLALGVVLLAAALGPRGGEEVRLGSPENPPQEEARVAQSEAPEDSSGQPAPGGSDSSGQLAPEGYSAQPAQEDYSAPGSLAATDTVTAPTETAPTETAPTDTVPTETAPTETAPTDTVPTPTAPIAPAPLEDSSSGQPPPRVTSCPQDKDRPGVICDKVPSQF